MTTLRERAQSKPAYKLVDLSELDEDLRKDIINDASEGGGTYGVRVVEESVNGPARFPIYGVYHGGADADRWEAAKEELGISGSEVDDSEVYQGAGGVDVTDPRREAALREAAAARANEAADRVRSGEIRDVAEIVGDNGGGTTGGDHPQNIVDTGLAADATNEAGNANATETAAADTRKSSNKAPK